VTGPNNKKQKARRKPGFLLCRKASMPGWRRDHMTLTIVGQILLLDRRRGQEIIGVAELLARVHAGANRFVGMALGRRGQLHCRTDDQQRAENGQSCLSHRSLL
jgi:hypothetical protein